MEERKIKTSIKISIDNLRRKGPVGVVTASEEEIFGLKGSSLVICRQKRAWLVDTWKEVLRLTLKELEGVRRPNKKDEHF